MVIIKILLIKAELVIFLMEVNGGESKKEMLVGSVLWEIYWVIFKNFVLIVVLVYDLECIEWVDVISVFGAIVVVEIVINVGEGSVDCVFGRLEVYCYSFFIEGGNFL